MSTRSSTATIIQAMRILANEIQSGDGVANAAIAEAADRLQELQDALQGLHDYSIRSKYLGHQTEALAAWAVAEKLLWEG